MRDTFISELRRIGTAIGVVLLVYTIWGKWTVAGPRIGLGAVSVLLLCACHFPIICRLWTMLRHQPAPIDNQIEETPVDVTLDIQPATQSQPLRQPQPAYHEEEHPIDAADANRIEEYPSPIEESKPAATERSAPKVPEIEPFAEPNVADEDPSPGNTAADTTKKSVAPDDAAIDTVEQDGPPVSQALDPFDCIRDSKIMAHYIVLDIETTGFSRDNDRIIEIAAIHYVFGEEVDRFHTYINPQIPIPNHITRLTGIRQADVDNAPLLDDIADDFCAYIKDYPLIGHNIIDFDLPFLATHMDLGEPHVVIDTLDLSRVAFPMLPSHKLSNLNYWFDLDDGTSHRADADASATNALMWACLYPEKYKTLYQKAVRKGIPENSNTHKPKINHHFQHINLSEIKPSLDHDIKSGPLAGKKIVFTGELSIPRKDAMQMAVDAGAILRSSVSSKTDYLVVGTQDITVVGTDGMSTKQEKAHELNTSGRANIQIIIEQEFLALVAKPSTSVTLVP